MRPAGMAALPASQWSGRLALQVEGGAPGSFAAGFELRGRPEAGELLILTPLGSTAARLEWSPGQARLFAGGQVREAASVDALAQEVTGAPLPVAALFDWLAGTATPIAGWQADLSELREGRLAARRDSPPPVARLRLVLER